MSAAIRPVLILVLFYFSVVRVEWPVTVMACHCNGLSL